jgi:hypothetical protein
MGSDEANENAEPWVERTSLFTRFLFLWGMAAIVFGSIAYINTTSASFSRNVSVSIDVTILYLASFSVFLVFDSNLKRYFINLFAAVTVSTFIISLGLMTKVLGWEKFVHIFDQEFFERILWGFGLGITLRIFWFFLDKLPTKF